jgi:sugar/nucleoside kinase (ribokinase family)
MKIPLSPPKTKNGVAAIGSALVDLCLTESEDFVRGSGAQTGGMVMVEHARIADILAKSANTPSVVPGGSACNTIVGIGKLGAKARFVGKRGDDEFGERFEKSVAAAGVEPVLSKSKTATGCVLSIITPDAQRSMLTCLGASAEIQPSEIKASYFEDCAIVHVEGYLLFNPEIMMTVLKAAKSAGALVSLDLASYTVVEASRALLDGMIADKYVDILIANEDEAAAFTGYKDDESKAAGALGEKAPLAVMKLGKRGSVIIHKESGSWVEVAPRGDGRPAVDTTGAGELWAAGFLYGLVHGYDLQKCGDLASKCGYEVCQVVGAHIPEDGWERIKR